MPQQQQHRKPSTSSASPKGEPSDFKQLMNRSVRYTPFKEADAIELTLEDARDVIAIPTKQGKLPTDRQLLLFLKLCEMRKLNPWVKDVYLIGYDTQDGPQFSGIVAHQALQKRADACPAYEGIESGLICWDRATKQMYHIPGDVAPNTFDIVGGYARVFRSDRKKVEFKTARMSAYNKGSGYWKTDPGWMIVKCAEAKALRAAFPNDLGGMMTVEEHGADEMADTGDNQAVNRMLYPAANPHAVNPAEGSACDTQQDSPSEPAPMETVSYAAAEPDADLDAEFRQAERELFAREDAGWKPEE